MRFGVIGIAVLSLTALGVTDALRSSKLADLQASGEVQKRFDSIRPEFEGWKSIAKEFDEKSLRETRAIAHSYRVYQREDARRSTVGVLMLAGNSGDIGAHDPERCYGGTGFRSVGPRTKKEIADGGYQHTFWCERFESVSLPAQSVEVCWAWTDAGHWQAAEDARSDYVGRTLLYKIYLTRSLTAGDETSDPIAELLKALTPLTRSALAERKP